MDFLAAEVLLKARLKGRLPPTVQVLSQIEVAAEGARQVTPAVHVVYGGAALVDQAAGAAKLEQTWLTVVAVRATNDPTGETARRAAGVLMTTLLQSLLGWRPPAQPDGLQLSPLAPADPLAPSVVDGVLYLPAAWVTTCVVRGIDDD